MGSISHYTCQAFLPEWVRLMDPKAPWPDFIANLEMLKDLPVQIRVGSQQLLDSGLLVPSLCGQIARLSREKAVVR